MITIKNKNDLEPYQKFYSLFSEAQKNNQKAIDAVSISSFNIETNEVESRYVNLKYIIDEEWIFFSNYNSKKASDFSSHDQISVLFYWDLLNVQIRIKAHIKKTDSAFSPILPVAPRIKIFFKSMIPQYLREVRKIKSLV